MNYKYKCGDEIIKVFVYNDNYHTTVTVRDNVTNKRYERTIRENENGKFFTWNKNRIYLDDWVRISMKELKDKIDKKEWVTPDDLCQAILTDGIDNVRFIIPLDIISGDKSYTNETKDTVCIVKEKWLMEVKNNYKLYLVPEKPDKTVVSGMIYYTSDMLTLIRMGYIEIIL